MESQSVDTLPATQEFTDYHEHHIKLQHFCNVTHTWVAISDVGFSN